MVLLMPFQSFQVEAYMESVEVEDKTQKYCH
jgi:hypothetical protein